MKKTLTILSLSLFLKVSAQNPYMPLWEHIPDGEPYVFEDPDRPGHQRVYVYGSHDELRQYYCGRDQVVWSAPVEDLTNWRYDGVIFVSRYAADGKTLLHDDGVGDVLYAPDVTEVVENGKKAYYLAPNNQEGGRNTMVARADRPDGPFKVCNWAADGKSTVGTFGFDPAIFVDDDGRVYGYWGFGHSYAAELDPKTMSSVKEGTQVVSDLISGFEQPGVFRFYEASSMRKIGGKYVLIYSRVTPEGEFGLPSTNYTLAYAYSDRPLGPYTYGGTIIDARARGVNEKGEPIETATAKGNTHGSVLKIGDQWWVFYHRQSGTNEYSRQAMVAPINVEVKGGKVLISEGEYTSEGFRTEGLNPLDRTKAGIMCYYTGPRPMRQDYPNMHYTGSYVAATYVGDDGMSGSYSMNTHHAPVVNNTAGSIIGYKYFNFDHFGGSDKARLELSLLPRGVKGEIVIMVDSPWTSRGGKELGRIALDGTGNSETTLSATVSGLAALKGKHALYMRFESGTQDASLCDLYNFIFRR